MKSLFTNYCSQKIDEIYRTLETSQSGLSMPEADRRLTLYGNCFASFAIFFSNVGTLRVSKWSEYGS